MAGRRKAKRQALEKTLASRDIGFERRERNWFTEDNVRWEEWYTEAARLSHRMGRVKYLLVR